MDTPMVSNDQFREAMRPLTTTLQTYATSIRDQPDEHGHLPGPDSRAVAELAAQQPWSVPDWQEPARNAHNYGGLMTYLIAEHLSAYAAIVESAAVGPAYAHMPTVRAVVEAVPIAHWLLDPTIGIETRIRRSIAYRLHSAVQQKRMVSVPGAVESAERSITACQGYATSQGWTVAAGGVAGEVLPRPTTYSTVALGEPSPELDRVMWAMACGTHHANWFALADGLQTRMLRNDPFDPLGGFAQITVEGSKLAMWAVAVFHGADAVVRARTELMGWKTSDAMQESRSAMIENSRTVVAELRRNLSQ